MMMASFLFKQKAREVLRGNWQTALVVTFFAGIFGTIEWVLTRRVFSETLTNITVWLAQAMQDVSGTALEELLMSLWNGISKAARVGIVGVNVLNLLFSPVLSVCCRYYFVRLNVGEDIGVQGGLTTRLSSWWRALWLYIVMGVKIVLWSLLLIIPGGIALVFLSIATGMTDILMLSSLFAIPGLIAALRYSMAPWYLADDPNLTAKQAIEKSKAVMKDKKFAFFMLEVSFVGWSLLISVAQMLLGGMLGTVLMLVAAQFMSLALSVYINASCAAFYRAVSHPDGMGELYTTMRNRMKQAGMSDSDISATGFGAPQEDENDNMDEDEDL